jgi:putative heme utilization carrier protein HutX
MTDDNAQQDLAMPGTKALELLAEISTWDNTVTIILHGGSVFEFKGIFPPGELVSGFYNLSGKNGFEGHLNLTKVASIAFQSKLHRGRESYAFVFQDIAGQCIFKIFVGRDQTGELHPLQKQRYLAYQEQYKEGEAR